MRMLSFATIAVCCAGAAAAAPSDDMVGTWECRQPGVNYRNKPPILYVDTASVKTPDKAAFALDVDGFTREVYGNSDVTADADGWWKVLRCSRLKVKIASTMKNAMNTKAR